MLVFTTAKLQNLLYSDVWILNRVYLG